MDLVPQSPCGAFTLAEFRAAHNLTAAQWSAQLRAGTAPAVTVDGGTNFITLEAAHAWQEAEAQRLIEALTFAAQICVDEL